jgi:hypothetical protein
MKLNNKGWNSKKKNLSRRELKIKGIEIIKIKIKLNKKKKELNNNYFTKKIMHTNPL